MFFFLEVSVLTIQFLIVLRCFFFLASYDITGGFCLLIYLYILSIRTWGEARCVVFSPLLYYRMIQYNLGIALGAAEGSVSYL